jgi:DNA phosphorothioation-dependent restriction protein DptG
MTPSKQDIALGALFILAGVMIFFFGKLSVHTPEVKPTLPDVSKYVKAIDSLSAENDKLKITNNRLFKSFDSLKLVKVNNIKKVNHGIKEIQNFTPDSRQLWSDSVLKSAGLK